MPIHYALFESSVAATPGTYTAVVKAIASADLNRMIDRMIDRGSTTARADILAVLEDAIGAAESMLLDGMRINFGGLVELFPRVRGVFNGPTDTFDRSRHVIDVGANAGSRVKRAVRQNATVIKDEAVKPAPNPLAFRDIATDSLNNTVTPGNIGELVGNRLKFNPLQADEGIFFLPIGPGVPLQASVLQLNKPSRLVFFIPAALLAGTYRLEVRSRIAGGLELRTGRLDAILTVG